MGMVWASETVRGSFAPHHHSTDYSDLSCGEVFVLTISASGTLLTAVVRFKNTLPWG
jgi:hypothetical protein